MNWARQPMMWWPWISLCYEKKGNQNQAIRVLLEGKENGKVAAAPKEADLLRQAYLTGGWVG